MRVKVELLNPDGTPEGRTATYDAPAGTVVGDTGEVHYGWEPWGRWYGARVVSLKSDYSGPCKAFRPAKAAVKA